MFCLSIAKTKAGNSSARRSFLATASLTSARAVEKCCCLSAAKMYHLGTTKALVECDSTRPYKIHQTIRRFRPTLPGKTLVEMSRSCSQRYRRSWYCIFNDVMLTGQTQRYASLPNKVSDRNTLPNTNSELNPPISAQQDLVRLAQSLFTVNLSNIATHF